MTEGIKDKIVVVTGASSGLGEATTGLRRQRTSRRAAVAVQAELFARAVAFALNQPPDGDINEILYRPTWQEV
jgi:NADP-dependent 3-hydroxy acid dehydrogenase YdfG